MNAYRWTATPVFLLLAALAMGGCTWGFGGREDVPEMHQKFSRTFDLQTGLVRGDLPRAQKAAQWIADQDLRTDLPAQAQARQDEMLGFAGQVAQSRDLDAAAAGAGQMAAACGGCHEALGAGPRFVVGQSAPDGTSQEAQMIRHLWAADRMWEGLVGPSDEAWEAGVAALSETVPTLLNAVLTAHDGIEPNQVVQVTPVAQEARMASTPADRALAYGKLLETCNECHKAVGIMAERSH
jgi:cytochrome c553